MAEEPKPKAEAKKGESIFKKKWHGVPVPLIAVGGGLVLYLGYRWYKNRQSATSSTTTPSTTSTGDTTGADNGLGGGFGGGGGQNYPNPSTPAIGPGTLLPIVPTTTPQAVTPGTTQVPLGFIVPNASGGNDQAAVTALVNAEAKLAEVTKTGNKKAIADATKNVATAQGVVNDRNATYLSAISSGATLPAPTPGAKTTPTGLAALQTPAAQALATSKANLAKAQAAEKKNPSAKNAAAVKAHESQVKAGR